MCLGSVLFFEYLTSIFDVEIDGWSAFTDSDCLSDSFCSSVFWPPEKWHGIYFWWHVNVCVSVCLSKALRYEVHFGNLVYLEGHWVKVRSQKQKGSRIVFPQCKTSTSSNSSTVKSLRAAYQIVYLPSLSRDRKWLHVSKCKCLWMVGLR